MGRRARVSRRAGHRLYHSRAAPLHLLKPTTGRPAWAHVDELPVIRTAGRTNCLILVLFLMMSGFLRFLIFTTGTPNVKPPGIFAWSPPSTKIDHDGRQLYTADGASVVAGRRTPLLLVEVRIITCACVAHSLCVTVGPAPCKLSEPGQKPTKPPTRLTRVLRAAYVPARVRLQGGVVCRHIGAALVLCAHRGLHPGRQQQPQVPLCVWPCGKQRPREWPPISGHGRAAAASALGRGVCALPLLCRRGAYCGVESGCRSTKPLESPIPMPWLLQSPW